MCVCMCACERGREKEQKRGRKREKENGVVHRRRMIGAVCIRVREGGGSER